LPGSGVREEDEKDQGLVFAGNVSPALTGFTQTWAG
jgi:hypothetical protein